MPERGHSRPAVSGQSSQGNGGDKQLHNTRTSQSLAAHRRHRADKGESGVGRHKCMNTQTSGFRAKPPRSGRRVVLSQAECFPRLVSPTARAQGQVHSRRFLRIYWTRPQTQSRSWVCPLKRRGRGRKGCFAPARRTPAPSYTSPREANETALRRQSWGLEDIIHSRCRESFHQGIHFIPLVSTRSGE